jgi:predicted DNA-binding protein
MPSKNPRINVVLDENLYKNIQLLAESDGVSLSATVKDLIKEALEIQEDLYLAAFAEEREKTWDKSTVRTHDEVWS